MGAEKLDRKLDQVEIKKTSPIRFKDDAINKIRLINLKLLIEEKKFDYFFFFVKSIYEIRSWSR